MERPRIKFYDDLGDPQRDQQEAFLKLTPAERLQSLFRLRKRYFPPAKLEGPKIKFRKPHVR
ncbi:MAG: hypothetical protein H7Y12_10580 [Sphingobacteriaceae bacterium]|nr:hypothetical protein [Cytophagaceae bacterium]